MSLTIWKFPLELVDEQDVEAPILKVLTVQMQKNVGPCLWAVVQPEIAPVKLRVWIVGTGHTGKDGVLRSGSYRGTFQMAEGALVFHVFTAFMEKGQVTLGV